MTLDDIVKQQREILGDALLDLISGAAEAEEYFTQEELEKGVKYDECNDKR